MNLTNVIFSHLHEDDKHVVNFVCTFIKQFVYKTRCLNEKTVLKRLIDELEYYHNIEFAIAKEEMRVYKHYKTWSPIFHFPEFDSHSGNEDNGC